MNYPAFLREFFGPLFVTSSHMRTNRTIFALLGLLFIISGCKKDPPTASFSYQILNCESPWQVKVYNGSEDADNYEWHGPDGVLSTGESPTLIIEGDDPIEITLLAIRGNRKKLGSTSKIIDPYTETRAVAASINWQLQSCSAPYQVYLNASGTSKHDQVWRFHDGSIVTQSSVNWTYSALGTYLVELGNVRCDDTAWVSTTLDISSVSTAPNAAFYVAESYELQPDIYLAGSTIRFEATTELWDSLVWVHPGGTSYGTELITTLPEGQHNIELQAWCSGNVDILKTTVVFAYPTGFYITALELQGVPVYPWDILDPVPNSPDMYLSLFDGANQIGANTTIEYDFQQGNTMTWAVDLTCSDVNKTYTIKGYDHDQLIDQLVGEADFKLMDVLQANPGNLVYSFTASDQGFVVVVHGDWY